MKEQQLRYMVQINIAVRSENVTNDALVAYIKEALASWGSAHPGTVNTDAPLFDGLEVRYIRIY